METRRRSRRFDRRKTVRRSRPSRALVRYHRLKGDRSENAYIQEMSSKGMRVTSGIPLEAKDRVVLYIGEEKKPVVAQVVWARKQGIIEKRMTGKPVKQIKISRKGVEFSNRLVRGVMIAAGLGLLALLIHMSFSLFSMLGSSSG